MYLFELLARLLLAVMPETETAWSLLVKGASWILEKTAGALLDSAIKTRVEAWRQRRRQAPPENTDNQQ
ncbi:hypothetical protein [Streptomyces sp. NPDC003697]